MFGIFGAAIAAGKLRKLTEDQMNSTLALCASLASSNLEGARSGGSACAKAARCATRCSPSRSRAAATSGGETVLEGEAGFYHAYTGNNLGRLTYSFVGDTKTSFDKITAGLGKDWMFLETLYRIYSIAGYNIAHVDVTAKLCEENDIRVEDIDRIEAVVNWIETQYPSPAFPSRREDQAGEARQHRLLHRVWRGRRAVSRLRAALARTRRSRYARSEVLDLMHRVTLIPSHDDDALRSAHHDLHEGRQELHEAEHRS